MRRASPVQRRPRTSTRPPIYYPSSVSPRRARVIFMYVGLAICVVLLLVFGKALATSDWINVSGGLIVITCGLFTISLGIVIYEGLYDAPTYSALPLPAPDSSDSLPPVLGSHDLIAQARVEAQQRMIGLEIDA